VHRSIGQERFGFAERRRGASSPDELGKLIDWGPVATLLNPLYPATKGEAVCGFSANEATPERTAFVRDRRLLVVHNLDRSLFETLTLQLKSKVVVVKTGTLIDATIIASASEEDDDAHWVKHKGKPAVPGFKAYVGADADTALVEEVSITPANINDGRAGPEALPDNPGEVFADSAYRGNH
jgi:IS5 family transposase